MGHAAHFSRHMHHCGQSLVSPDAWSSDEEEDELLEVDDDDEEDSLSPASLKATLARALLLLDGGSLRRA
eukprot:4001408-Karenia_brevis.AAC.1